MNELIRLRERGHGGCHQLGEGGCQFDPLLSNPFFIANQ